MNFKAAPRGICGRYRYLYISDFPKYHPTAPSCHVIPVFRDNRPRG